MSRILIVGGGLAGLFTALKLAPRPVTVLSPAPLGEGASSAWAQGGIAAAVSEGDSPEAHTADTVAAGAGLVDEAVMLAVAREAPARIDDLLAFGVPFDRDLEGRLAVSREAAHSARRIVRVDGDRAGAAVMAALVAAVRRTPSITVVEGATVDRLAVEDGRVTGVSARMASGARLVIPAGAVVLATGGIGHCYAVTTNPAEASGLGLAVAAEAGALVADPEFVQFHPTALAVGRDPAPLATEALRGEGAILVDRFGRRFLEGVHPDAELAPRDVVARAVHQAVASGRGAFLDTRAAIGDRVESRFPTVFAAAMAAGVDPRLAPIPVAPAAHYHMGGIATCARGRTNVPGLWAVGEVASTGVHGANRLASNSLLEAVVFGARVAEDLFGVDLPDVGDMVATVGHVEADERPISDDIRQVRRVLSAHVGVVRTGDDLAEAVVALDRIATSGTTRRARLMATVGLLVATAALARTETRGGHCRADHPAADPAQARRTVTTLAAAKAAAAALADAKRLTA
ncbi:L-aspartate oxidase [Chthonobacter rhizosphaerae]|uniref:L-aspartate oxidase n=1 Tax=Chthonobacter rhizosphaerae TaxID=2735553 RepID=UPI0015EF2576|nr:L-aspartate oxidase [Chthonobacter rhizosphaerae]